MPSPENVRMSDENASKSTYFPLGYKASASQWWAGVAPTIAESHVISLIPHLQKPWAHDIVGNSNSALEDSAGPLLKGIPSDLAAQAKDPHGPRACYSNTITLAGKDRTLNELSIERTEEEVEYNLVMLHGYGAGLGFFYKNFEGLSQMKGWKIYALDMLGMGRSSRPPFKIHSKSQSEQVTEAENWFIDALEEWRITRKLKSFTLLGHSLGGYMAVAYALKYPGRLNKLILASPVGIPEDPYAVRTDLPEPKDSTLANEFTQTQDSIMKDKKLETKIDNNPPGGTHSKASSPKKDINPTPRRPLPRWLVYLWDANISPFSIIRWTGPLGPRFVSGWSSRRFSQLPIEESKALHEYAYSLFRQRGSGEYALAYILAPGAFARSPLINRIHKVGRQYFKSNDVEENTTGSSSSLQPEIREAGIPIVFIYGENDWMDVAAGYLAEKKLEEEKSRVLKEANEEERRRENGSAKVLVIKNAGHHLYLDGWEEFNEVIREEMKDTERNGWKR
ncbi:BgTH12-06804 [Blumeria graminis f. sp. triticale]|uniref:Bgt-319 n=4 Tax=Blumeria graminis TaxID=34373 RepID=A0A9X9MNI0_BLUGR|nr:BgTH12-06804 [Blumeria graminis f. sp. triticale]VDB94461.1 Bgt-319 [Blumeria graminis f. sp. tritici]